VRQTVERGPSLLAPLTAELRLSEWADVRALGPTSDSWPALREGESTLFLCRGCCWDHFTAPAFPAAAHGRRAWALLPISGGRVLSVDTASAYPSVVARAPGWPAPLLMNANTPWDAQLQMAGAPYSKTDVAAVCVTVDVGVTEARPADCRARCTTGAAGPPFERNWGASLRAVLYAAATRAPPSMNQCLVLLDTGEDRLRELVVELPRARSRSLRALVHAVRAAGGVPPRWQLSVPTRRHVRGAEGEVGAACVDVEVGRPWTLDFLKTHAPTDLRGYALASHRMHAPARGPVVLMRATPWRTREVAATATAVQLARDMCAGPSTALVAALNDEGAVAIVVTRGNRLSSYHLALGGPADAPAACSRLAPPRLWPPSAVPLGLEPCDRAALAG
jgi:hypothetical protein